jgi:hypothetical protein
LRPARCGFLLASPDTRYEEERPVAPADRSSGTMVARARIASEKNTTRIALQHEIAFSAHNNAIWANPDVCPP